MYGSFRNGDTRISEFYWYSDSRAENLLLARELPLGLGRTMAEKDSRKEQKAVSAATTPVRVSNSSAYGSPCILPLKKRKICSDQVLSEPSTCKRRIEIGEPKVDKSSVPVSIKKRLFHKVNKDGNGGSTLAAIPLKNDGIQCESPLDLSNQSFEPLDYRVVKLHTPERVSSTKHKPPKDQKQRRNTKRAQKVVVNEMNVTETKAPVATINFSDRIKMMAMADKAFIGGKKIFEMSLAKTSTDRSEGPINAPHLSGKTGLPVSVSNGKSNKSVSDEGTTNPSPIVGLVNETNEVPDSGIGKSKMPDSLIDKMPVDGTKFKEKRVVPNSCIGKMPVNDIKFNEKKVMPDSLIDKMPVGNARFNEKRVVPDSRIDKMPVDNTKFTEKRVVPITTSNTKSNETRVVYVTTPTSNVKSNVPVMASQSIDKSGLPVCATLPNGKSEGHVTTITVNEKTKKLAMPTPHKVIRKWISIDNRSKVLAIASSTKDKSTVPALARPVNKTSIGPANASHSTEKSKVSLVAAPSFGSNEVLATTSTSNDKSKVPATSSPDGHKVLAKVPIDDRKTVPVMLLIDSRKKVLAMAPVPANASLPNGRSKVPTNASLSSDISAVAVNASLFCGKSGMSASASLFCDKSGVPISATLPNGKRGVPVTATLPNGKSGVLVSGSLSIGKSQGHVNISSSSAKSGVPVNASSSCHKSGVPVNASLSNGKSKAPALYPLVGDGCNGLAMSSPVKEESKLPAVALSFKDTSKLAAMNKNKDNSSPAQVPDNATSIGDRSKMPVIDDGTKVPAMHSPIDDRNEELPWAVFVSDGNEVPLMAVPVKGGSKKQNVLTAFNNKSEKPAMSTLVNDGCGMQAMAITVKIGCDDESKMKALAMQPKDKNNLPAETTLLGNKSEMRPNKDRTSPTILPIDPSTRPAADTSFDGAVKLVARPSIGESNKPIFNLASDGTSALPMVAKQYSSNSVDLPQCKLPSDRHCARRPRKCTPFRLRRKKVTDIESDDPDGSASSSDDKLHIDLGQCSSSGDDKPHIGPNQWASSSDDKPHIGPNQCASSRDDKPRIWRPFDSTQKSSPNTILPEKNKDSAKQSHSPSCQKGIHQPSASSNALEENESPVLTDENSQSIPPSSDDSDSSMVSGSVEIGWRYEGAQSVPMIITTGPTRKWVAPDRSSGCRVVEKYKQHIPEYCERKGRLPARKVQQEGKNKKSLHDAHPICSENPTPLSSRTGLVDRRFQPYPQPSSSTTGDSSANVTQPFKTNGGTVILKPEPDNPASLQTFYPYTPLGFGFSHLKYKCVFCAKLKETLDQMVRHYKRHHSGEKPYECPHCRARFSDLYSYANHCDEHLTKRDFPEFLCHFCSQATSSRWQMKLHLFIAHESVQNLSCKTPRPRNSLKVVPDSST